MVYKAYAHTRVRIHNYYYNNKKKYICKEIGSKQTVHIHSNNSNEPQKTSGKKSYCNIYNDDDANTISFYVNNWSTVLLICVCTGKERKRSRDKESKSDRKTRHVLIRFILFFFFFVHLLLLLFQLCTLYVAYYCYLKSCYGLVRGFLLCRTYKLQRRMKI